MCPLPHVSSCASGSCPGVSGGPVVSGTGVDPYYGRTWDGRLGAGVYSGSVLPHTYRSVGDRCWSWFETRVPTATVFLGALSTSGVALSSGSLGDTVFPVGVLGRLVRSGPGFRVSRHPSLAPTGPTGSCHGTPHAYRVPPSDPDLSANSGPRVHVRAFTGYVDGSPGGLESGPGPPGVGTGLPESVV